MLISTPATFLLKNKWKNMNACIGIGTTGVGPFTPDGLRHICAAYENDPEKIDIHRPEMMAKFRNEGIID